MKALFGLIALCVTAGCSAATAPAIQAETTGTAQAEPAASCVAPIGHYSEHFTALSGNCGDQADRDVNIADDSAAKFRCMQTSSYDSGCAGVHMIVCTNAENASSWSETRNVQWDANGESAVGTIDYNVTAKDGSPLCHSTYQVNLSRKVSQ